MITNHQNHSRGMAFCVYPCRLRPQIFTTLLFIGIFFAAGLFNQASGQNDQKPQVSPPVTPDTFMLDLRRAPRSKAWKEGDPIRVIPQSFYRDSLIDTPNQPLPEGKNPGKPPKKDNGNTAEAPSGESPEAGAAPGISLPANIKSFQGISATGAVPPDVVGDVGPNHYIQMVNTDFAIYDKAGNLLVGPTPINSLWAGFGGACETTNHGDPIVQYDPIADRWLMSQFAVPGGAAGFHECICISRTPDPVAGGWYRYDFATRAFPDYPKIGVWPDAYYMSTYEGPNLGVFAFDRNRMLAGLPAFYINFTIPSLSAGRPQTRILPSDLDGATPPPAGSPNLFMRSVDGPLQGGGEDRLEIFEFRANFVTPALSTFINTLNLATAPYDIEMCGPALPRTCIPQPGTTQTLDPLSNRLMRQLQYRNFGTYETLVANQTVDANGNDHAGIRWYELRRAGGAWSIHQQGTHSPDNAVHRWMGSMAMNGDGEMALGYSVSSRSVFPGIRYASRTASDPPGALSAETILMNGAGSQTGSSRWGDYSSMNVDPSDDCTFWYTTEYYDATSPVGWKTLISRIDNPMCGLDFKYMYAAKIICGKQLRPDHYRLAPGVYSTAINIHNPGNDNVEFFKKLALTYPPDAQEEGKIYPIAVDKLGPDGALEVDCIDLQRKLFPKGFPASYIKGFVVLESPKPLDVTGVYTAAKPRSFLSPQRVTSIDVEQINERILKEAPLKPTGCPDLVVSDIADAPKVDCPGGGGTCVTTVKFTIANTGTANAGAFNIRIALDPSVVINQAVPGGLAAGATLTFTVSSPPGGNCYNPDCTVIITVDDGNAVEECKEDNNRALETTLG
ncbi:MAG: hypothetical protein IPJ82_13350 [Lewinellaceae bacterium]|nr:hypothetical protein [Lewinellaceae bacterium]